MRTINFFIFLVIGLYPISKITGQSKNLSSEYVIQVAAYSNMENYKQNKSAFSVLNKYGIIYHDEKQNGIVKV